MPHHLKQKQKRISPTRKKIKRMSSIKCGRRNTFALPAQYTNQGPLTRGAFTRKPSHSLSPCDATRAAAWTRVELSHVHATSVPPPRSCGLAWLCHVVLCAMSHLRDNYPLFCLFLEFLKDLKNENKFR